MPDRYKTMCELRGNASSGMGCSKETMAWCALRGRNPGGSGLECTENSLAYLDTVDPGFTPRAADPIVNPYAPFP